MVSTTFSTSTILEPVSTASFSQPNIHHEDRKTVQPLGGDCQGKSKPIDIVCVTKGISPSVLKNDPTKQDPSFQG